MFLARHTFWASAAAVFWIAVFWIITAVPAEAVPAFARRYATSCATCHQAFPRLNGVGEAFRLAGFRFVDDERYRKFEPVEMGDEAYKRLWPKALWPGDIPRHSPLSFVGRLMVEQDVDNTRPASTSMLLPEEVELVWAGNLGDDIAFYGDVIYLQKDFGGADPDSWATIKTWVQFQDVFGPENAFNVRVGTIGTQTMGLFTARDANFYGTHFYLYTSWELPMPSLPEAGLTEFKGNYFSIGPQAGVELNGYGKRWFYAFGIANGDRPVPASGRPTSDVSFFGMGQGSDLSDFYVHFAYKWGGVAFDRSGEEPGKALGSGAAEFWRDPSFVVSLFGYSGKASIEAADLAGSRWSVDEDFWRLGIGLQKQWNDVSLAIAYMEGSDKNPYGLLSDAAVDSTSWHVELLGFAYPWLIPFARYEAVELDMPTGIPGLNPEQDTERIVAGAKFLLRPNVSAIIEGAHYLTGEELEEGFDGTVFMLLAVSF